jgi:hypothetical protein
LRQSGDDLAQGGQRLVDIGSFLESCSLTRQILEWLGNLGS